MRFEEAKSKCNHEVVKQWHTRIYVLRWEVRGLDPNLFILWYVLSSYCLKAAPVKYMIGKLDQCVIPRSRTFLLSICGFDSSQ